MMRRILFCGFAAAVLTAGISCQQPDAPAADKGSITLSNSEDIVFPETGGSSQVAFSATGDWTAGASADWLGVEPKAGAAGQTLSVTVSASANKTSEKLTAELTLACGSDRKSIKVILSEPIELPETPVTWPADADALDAGLEIGRTRSVVFSAEEFAKYGVTSSSRSITTTVTVDGITFGGPGLAYYDNRITAEKVNTQWSSEYPNIIPSQCFFSFKINRPGAISFFQSLGTAIDRIPTYYLAVVTTIDGKTSAKIVDECTPTKVTDERPAKPYNGGWEDYIISLGVPESAIKGISEAATVYLFHRFTSGNTCNVHYYPFTWTVGAEGNQGGQGGQGGQGSQGGQGGQVGKILIAGDSGVCEYGEASRPQTGWGECLSEALGGGVKISNYAIGGESTKSFIDEGRWASLCTNIVAGDIVIIHFGANDQKDDEPHHTDPYGTYQDNLKKMIDDATAKGGVPVLVTSMCRLYFHSNGSPQRTHGEYPAAMKALGTSTHTPVVDLQELTYQWLKGLGSVEAAEPYFVLDKRGNTSNPDRSHLTGEGARIVAGMVAQSMIELGVWQVGE